VSDQPELYRLAEDLPELPGDVVLVYHFDGFVDAGQAGGLATRHLLCASDPRDLAEFDTDLLIDYRSRRPTMTFDADHWVDYEQPELAVRLCEDAIGTPFLLMTGPEPDYGWERFIASVRALFDRFGVRLAIGIQGIPMAVPHTRDAGITAHGNRGDLFEGRPQWIDRVQVPGSAGGLLEYRMIESGRDAIGFAVHVPHYLAQSEYPPAAVALLDAITAATGLVFPTTALHEAAERTGAEIEAQVDASPEIAEAVRNLERNYDAAASAAKLAGKAEESMPTADEIAAEFERFLADRDDD
jgi:hypothetical protein